MGIEDEKIEQIIDMHSETVDGLKAEITAAKGAKATEKKGEEKPSATKPEDTDAYKALKAEFDKYKADTAEKEAKAAKEKAVRAYFEGKKISGKNLDIAMRGAAAEIAGLEMDGDKIKDAKALDDLVSGVYSGLVTQTETAGAKTPNPPAATGKTAKTKAEIMAIKDDSERWSAMRDNPELFGLDK